jgi:hypothetical protein
MNGNVWYMILSLNSAADAAVRISFSKTAPSGGSTTVTPTSTDQWFPNGSAPATATDFTINAAAADNSRVSIGLTSVGDFYWICNKQGANLPNLGIVFCALMEYQTLDLAPVFAGYEYSATGIFRAAHAGGTNSGGVINLNTSRVPITLANSATKNSIGYLTHDNGTTSADFSAIGEINGLYYDYPCWIMTGASTSQITTIRGRIADIACCPYPSGIIAEGIGEPVGGPYVRAKAGGLWLPVNAEFNFA